MKTSRKFFILLVFIVLVFNLIFFFNFTIRKLSKETEKKEKLLSETNLQDLLDRNKKMKQIINIKIRESDNWWKEKRNFQTNPHLITIGIPTIERIKSGKVINYLETTVESLYNCLLEYKQFYPNSIHKIKVLIQSSVPGQKHEIFEKLSKDKKYKEDFVFYSPKDRLMDPHKDIPGHDYTHPDNYIPGKKARQQTYLNGFY
jgi:hypothetical protein